jgi:diacylglycerol kinase (ATP)
MPTGQGQVMRRRVLIIVNPAAGGSRFTLRRLGRVVAALERRGCTAVLRHASARAGDVERLAREAEPEFEAIVAAGGDGTVNAVVNGLAGMPRPLALLRLGTANLLAREIGLPRQAERLAELIATAPARPVWPGRVNGRLFMTMASTGFDAEIVAGVDPRLKRYAGRLAFIWAMLARLWLYRPCELLVEADGVEHRAAGLIAAKGRFYAGPYIVAPRANPADPVLELVLFRRAGRIAILGYAWALLRGRLSRSKHVTLLRAPSAVVSGSRSLPVQADGEIVGHLPATIGIAEQPLFLIRPRP